MILDVKNGDYLQNVYSRNLYLISNIRVFDHVRRYQVASLYNITLKLPANSAYLLSDFKADKWNRIDLCHVYNMRVFGKMP